MDITFFQGLWFLLIFVLIAGYFVLDGFDLGAGVLYPFVAKNDKEKAVVRTSIGPVWDGNEVWLLTAGGALFAAFPAAYATTFSGFYLAVMLVLFGLIVRAGSLEFRAHDPKWAKVWDVCFVVGSLLPALLLGVAVGNIYAGIPMDMNGDYVGVPLLGLITPFTLLCGLLAPAGDPRKRFSRPRIAGQAAVLLLYLALIGFPVSAVRAGFVYLVALGGYFFVQPPDTLTSMGLAALVLGIQNAYFVCDLGFQLSFSAVLGVQAASALARWERRRLPPQDSPLRETARRALLWLAETLQVTVLATLATMPVLLARGMTVSGVGVLTNLLVVWMLQPALVLGIGVLLLSVLPFLSFAMHGLSLVLALWLRAMCAVIGWCASLPGARLALPAAYTLFVLAVLGVLAAVFWRMRKFGWYLPAAAVCAALAIGLGVRMDRDVVRIAVVGTAGNPCLVVTQNGQAAVLFRGGSSNLRAVQEYLDNAGGLPQTLLVDLRQDPRAMEFDAETVIPMDSLDSGLAAQTILDGVTLELVHDPGGNLAVLDINGYTVGIMAGRARLAQPLALNIYCAGASYPDSIDADTVIYTSRAADWLEEADAELLYGPEEPVVTIRPGRSATIDGVKKYAVQ